MTPVSAELFRYSGTLVAVVWSDQATRNAWNGTALVPSTRADLVAGSTTAPEDEASTGLFTTESPDGLANINWLARFYAVSGDALTTADLANAPIAEASSPDAPSLDLQAITNAVMRLTPTGSAPATGSLEALVLAIPTTGPTNRPVTISPGRTVVLTQP
jgi:hypothetical protein